MADTLKRISETICTDYLGFKPTSNSTKPSHIANGLFRNCTGEVCNVKDIHNWVISDDRKDAIPSEKIIEDYQDILQKGYQEDPTDIKQFRHFLDEIFDQDNAMYTNFEFSVMAISSHWMIKKRVASEAGIGEFLFEILSKKIDGKRSPMIKLLQETLAYDKDDITKLVKPIIALPSEETKVEHCEPPYIDDNESNWDSCKETIRNGFDQLAQNLIHIGENSNTLVTLQRIVNFSIFATLFYLTHCVSTVSAAPRVPIILDANCNLDSIKKASEQAFSASKKAVELYFQHIIRIIISQEISSDTKEACLAWIDSMSFSPKREEKVKPAIISYFESFVDEEPSKITALAKALQISLFTFEYKSSSPSDFCRVLGIRCGLVGPKGNRASKRYLPNSFTLENITLSVLSTSEIDEGIEIKDLEKRLQKCYNIIIGADSENAYELLESFNIAQSTPGDLRGDLCLNARAFGNTYISLGLGKQYADGVTLIGRGL